MDSDFFGGLLYGLNISDFSIPLGILVWALLLAFPLTAFDCQDNITGSIYAAFCGAAGIIVVLIVPKEFHNFVDFKSQAAMTVFFIFVAFVRWAAEGIKQKDQRLNRKG